MDKPSWLGNGPCKKLIHPIRPSSALLGCIPVTETILSKPCCVWAKKESKLEVVSDQVGTPTYARDLAKAILAVLPQLNNTEVEILHYSNAGFCSWYDFAKAIFELSGISIEVHPIATSQYPTVAKRPFYSVLNKEKIKDKYAVEIPHWNAALKDCLHILGKGENIF